MRLPIAVLALTASGLVAQDTTGRRETLCVVPRDGTRCMAYTITEVGASRAFTSTRSRLVDNAGATSTKTDFGWSIHGAIGLARNFGNRKSIGAAMIVDRVKSDPGFAGVELRYRDWIDTSQKALELHLGYGRSEYETVSPSGNRLEFRRFPGVRAAAALHIGPYATVFTRGELTISRGERHSGLFAGGGATSHASYKTVAVAVLATVLFAIFAQPPT